MTDAAGTNVQLKMRLDKCWKRVGCGVRGCVALSLRWKQVVVGTSKGIGCRVKKRCCFQVGLPRCLCSALAQPARASPQAQLLAAMEASRVPPFRHHSDCNPYSLTFLRGPCTATIAHMCITNDC